MNHTLVRLGAGLWALVMLGLFTLGMIVSISGGF